MPVDGKSAAWTRQNRSRARQIQMFAEGSLPVLQG
jgi:hypothetical protein